MTRSSRLALLRTLSIVGVAVGLSLAGCDKGGSTTDPGSEDAGRGGTHKAAGIGFSYPSEFKLNSEVALAFELGTPMGSGDAQIKTKSLIEATTSGAKLKIHGKTLELVEYKGTGQLDPEFIKKQAEAEGQPAMDLVGELSKAESWSVVDVYGATDEEATKALAENQAKADGMDFGLFELPELPTQPLEVGKPWTTKREDTTDIQGIAIPVEIEETWTLVEIDESAGGRVAKLQKKQESNGAAEVNGGTISIYGEDEVTLMFDLGTNLPVSLTATSTSELQFDMGAQSGTVSNNSELTATYTRAE